MMSFQGAKTSVAVVIPVCGDASGLSRAVASCQRQTRRVDEIVIVDGGSPGPTPALVKSLMEADARIRYLRSEKDRGAQAARIEGIVASGAEWVALLDADGELLQDSVQSRLDAVARCGFEAGVVFGDLVSRRDAGDEIVRSERLSGYAFPRLCRTLAAPPCSAQMIRRKCFAATGYPSPDLPGLHGADMALTVGKIFPVLHCGKPVAVWKGAPEDEGRLAAAYGILVERYAKDIRRHHGETGLFLRRVSALLKIIVNCYHVAADALYRAFFQPRRRCAGIVPDRAGRPGDRGA